MNKLSVFLAFAFGVTVGATGTYIYINDKYNKQLEHDLEELKGNLECPDMIDEEIDEEEVPVINPARAPKPSIYTEYDKIIKKEAEEKKQEEEEVATQIEDENIIIEPDFQDGLVGFGEGEYDTVFATIYADGYLVDDMDHCIDIFDIGGREVLEHFGEGDDPELLHVRNELTKTDYEIDRDERTYQEVSGKSEAELPDLDY